MPPFKYGPEESESMDYLREMDNQTSELIKSDCLVAITADHGMNAKNKGVIYLEEIVPSHHASLGSYATIYLSKEELKNTDSIIQTLLRTEGIESVYKREKAAKLFNLPKDRIGHLVLVSKKQYVLGTSKSKHDLSVLDRPLRSHGGLTEQKVPFILSSVLKTKRKPRNNYDIFEYCLNDL